jgi:translation initiation factor 2 subunit 1
MSFGCRIYKNKYPSLNDLVVVKIMKIVKDVGVYVSLLEYGEIEALLVFSELSRKFRLRTINKYVQVGEIQVLTVIDINDKKGHINLSRIRASSEDKKKANERFEQSKMVYSIVKNVSMKIDTSIEKLYELFVWDLYEKYEHAYEAFKLVRDDPKILDYLNLDKVLLHALVTSINHSFASTQVNVITDIQVTYLNYHGIDAIKKSLSDAENNLPVKIRLVSSPHHSIEICSHKEQGIKILESAIKIIENTLKTFDGELVVVIPPRVIEDNRSE